MKNININLQYVGKQTVELSK